MFRTILADPPWQYSDKLVMSLTSRGADDHYGTMSVADISRLFDLNDHKLCGYEIEEDAFLFLWTTNPFLLTGEAVRVCQAWGFQPKQIVTWVKGRIAIDNRLVLRTGMGHYTRGATEQLILATRGRPKIYVKNQGVNNVILADEDTTILEGPRGHSRKPEAAYQLIERVVDGPYLELFARQRREGWESWGNQLV